MKGIIVEVKGNSAVMLNDKGEFRKVENRNFTVGEKINYRSKGLVYYVACSFALLISLLSVSTYGLFVPVSYVDIDINPSVRMNVNYFDRVIGYEALNSDGELIISNLKKGKVSECIEDVISASENRGYLNEKNNLVDINVVSPGNKCVTIVEEAADGMESKGFHIYVHKRDKHILEKADELGISMGKYLTIEKYTEAFGGDLAENSEKLKEISIREIKDVLASKDERAEDKNKKQEERTEEKAERAEEKAGKQEERSDEKAEKTEEKAGKQEERSDEKAEKTEEKAGKQEERSEEKAEKAEEKAGKQEERSEEKAEKAEEKAGKQKDRPEEKTGKAEEKNRKEESRAKEKGQGQENVDGAVN